MISLWLAFYLLHDAPRDLWWSFPALLTAYLAVCAEGAGCVLLIAKRL